MQPSTWNRWSFSARLLIAWLAAQSALTVPAAGQTAVTSPAPCLVTNFYSGPATQRINIVVLGDGYTAAEFPLFAQHVTNIVSDFLFTREPFMDYQPYFNVYSISTASLESGADHPYLGAYRDTYFNSTFDYAGIEQLLVVQDTSRLYNLLSLLMPQYNIVIVIVNDGTYGGSGGTFAVTSVETTAPGIMMHEVGHSFGSLADEYEDVTPGHHPAESPNVTAQTNRSLIKWTAWIDATTPLPTPYTTNYASTPGLFEGAMYTNRNWYRPHYASFMRWLGQPVGQVNADHLIKKFYSCSPDHIEVFRGYEPAGSVVVTQGHAMAFSVAPMQPAEHNLDFTWTLDGAPLASGTNPVHVFDSTGISNGNHTLTCVALDATPQVRIYTNDYFLQNVMTKTQSWSVSVTNRPPVEGDADGDAMPDAWELLYFGRTAAPGGGAGEDYDGDGLSNYGEYRAGTDPSSGASLLKISASVTGPVSFSDAVLRWPAATGRVYGIKLSTNLQTGWSIYQSGIPATPPENVHTMALPAGRTFWRVRVE